MIDAQVICTQLYYGNRVGGKTTDNVVVNEISSTGFTASTGDKSGKVEVCKRLASHTASLICSLKPRIFSWIAVGYDAAWIRYGRVLSNGSRQGGSQFEVKRMGIGHWKVRNESSYSGLNCV